MKSEENNLIIEKGITIKQADMTVTNNHNNVITNTANNVSKKYGKCNLVSRTKCDSLLYEPHIF